MAQTTANIRPANHAVADSSAETIVNPYRARYATNSDASTIDSVVRSVFGSTAPNSSTSREMRRNNTTYIVATKNDGNGNFTGDATQQDATNGWRHRITSLFSSYSNNSGDRQSSSIVGAVGIWTPVDQAHIMMIATHGDERRRGVGDLLIIATLCEAIKNGAINVTLEVRKSNDAARALYGKYGFSDIGVRRNYYANNREDAVIMATPSFTDLSYIRTLQRRCHGYFIVRGETELQVDPGQYLALP